MTIEVTISKLRTETLPKTSRGRCLEMLTARLVYRVRGPGLLSKVIVPKGFVTDAATTPMFLWWLFPPDGPWKRASVIHDYMYRTGYSRIQCDAAFRHVMEVDEIPAWRRCAMFYAVRVGGWRPWRRYKMESTELVAS